jgi:GT2 family glycosyltransferase
MNKNTLLKKSISVLIGTRNRYKPLIRCLNKIFKQNYTEFEVLVMDDNSEKYDICKILSEKIKDKRIRYFRSNKQLGVAGGRNYLMRKAKGDIFIVIDDDAIFSDSECITRIVKHFYENPQVGIIASKIINCPNGKPADFRVPFAKRVRKKCPEIINKKTFVSYYLGGCHAIRREVIKQCGYYQEQLVYGTEELDLSYRVIKKGFEIIYCPDIIVYHYPESSVVGNKKNAKGELYYSLRNRYWISYKYIPLPYMLSYILGWSGHYILQALKNKEINEYIHAIKDGILGLKKIKRTTLDKESMTYLKKNYGRLWH